MAGDWIKMRVNIDRDPRVIEMTLVLSEHKQFLAWLTEGMNCTVTNAFDRVTPVTLRHVVVTALLRLWGGALDRGKRIECTNDLRLSHCSSFAVDEIAGVPGISDALESVGWLRFDGDAIFPNLLESNVPANERQVANKREKDRERQRRHREKQRDTCHDSVTQPVTHVSRKSRPRSDKSRLEHNIPPKPPKGGVLVTDIEFPEGMDTAEVKAAMDDWLKHKRRIGSTYKSADGPTRLIQKWLMAGPEMFIEAVNHSISMNYKGVYNGGNGDGRSSAQRQQDDNFRAIQDFVRQSELREVDGDVVFAEADHLADQGANGCLAQGACGLPASDD